MPRKLTEGERHLLCKPCRKCGFTDRYESTGACRPCITSRLRAQRITDQIRFMLYDAKKRAKKKHLPFDLRHEDLTIPQVCPLLGIPLNHETTDNMPSIDRIKPLLGYVRGNVWVVSYRANRIKNDSTLEELEMIAENWRNLGPTSY